MNSKITTLQDLTDELFRTAEESGQIYIDEDNQKLSIKGNEKKEQGYKNEGIIMMCREHFTELDYITEQEIETAISESQSLL